MLILGVLGACFCIVFYLFIFALLKAADDEEPPKATPSPVPVAWAKYPVPLDKEMQLYVVEESTKKGVSPCVVFAIIQTESDFDAGKIGDNGRSYGLMQVYASEHTDRCLALNAVNLLDPRQNVTVGIDILAELNGYKMPLEWVLMAYNGGPTYANEMAKAGKTSQYAKDVLNYMNELEEF